MQFRLLQRPSNSRARLLYCGGCCGPVAWVHHISRLLEVLVIVRECPMQWRLGFKQINLFHHIIPHTCINNNLVAGPVKKVRWISQYKFTSKWDNLMWNNAISIFLVDNIKTIINIAFTTKMKIMSVENIMQSIPGNISQLIFLN